MARVTIENCLKKVNGHFDLVLLAGERAKQISAGRKSDITKKGIKTHVTALREIEEDAVAVSALRENIHDRINHVSDVDEQKEESDDLVEELQSSEFITGELEEISDNDEFFASNVADTHDDETEEDEEIDIDFGEDLDNENK